ncbi:hypothetical protein BB558_001266 [Smittium angustum]|uniref:Palmitoyltransferase n=1 Tax=Smittium angustum TaxID=133377 RepID=A0A2U1JBW5_SMIAN|nr:hypothetical protein BB558_001266 [Smittium angustum]
MTDIYYNNSEKEHSDFINKLPILFSFVFFGAEIYFSYIYLISPTQIIHPSFGLFLLSAFLFLNFMTIYSFIITALRNPGRPNIKNIFDCDEELVQTIQQKIIQESSNSTESSPTIVNIDEGLDNEENSLLTGNAIRYRELPKKKTITFSFVNPETNESSSKTISICLKCKDIKPDRCHHCKISSKDITTIESYKHRLQRRFTNENIVSYNQGYRKNLISVFGTKWYHWFLPTDTVIGDGHSFKYSTLTEAHAA